jgi:hypothetical protein
VALAPWLGRSPFCRRQEAVVFARLRIAEVAGAMATALISYPGDYSCDQDDGAAGRYAFLISSSEASRTSPSKV